MMQQAIRWLGISAALIVVTLPFSSCSGGGGRGGDSPGITADSDGDGVPDDEDLCPDTAEGATVDASGCSAGQTPNTPTPTSSPAGTPTATPTTPAGTPTATPTTPAGTPTATPTTPAGTPTATPTSSPAGTPTATPTSSPAGTPTATPTSTPDPTPSDVICRNANFWGKHAGSARNGSRDLTGAAIAAGGGCLEICGEVITSTDPIDSANSAIEAMCLPGEADSRLQLARHLTAAALNCAVTNGGANCAGVPGIEETFAACNDACTLGGTTGVTSGGPVDCVAVVDCFNNGGTVDVAAGTCQRGVCVGDDAEDQPCGPGFPECPEFETCKDLEGTCNDASFGFCSNLETTTFCRPDRVEEDCGRSTASCIVGRAGSEANCAAATNSACAVLAPGEQECADSGNECAITESCCDPAICGPVCAAAL